MFILDLVFFCCWGFLISVINATGAFPQITSIAHAVGVKQTSVFNSINWRHVANDFELLRVLLIVLNHGLVHRHQINVLRVREIALCWRRESEEDQDGVDEFHCCALLCAVVFVCFVELIRNSRRQIPKRVTKTPYLLHLMEDSTTDTSADVVNYMKARRL